MVIQVSPTTAGELERTSVQELLSSLDVLTTMIWWGQSTESVRKMERGVIINLHACVSMVSVVLKTYEM